MDFPDSAESVGNATISDIFGVILACKNVLDYISLVKVINSSEDLVAFVKTVAPALSRLTAEVSLRAQTLSSPELSAKLASSIERLKQITPMLVSSIRALIVATSNGSPTELTSLALKNRDRILRLATREIEVTICLLREVDSQVQTQVHSGVKRSASASYNRGDRCSSISTCSETAIDRNRTLERPAVSTHLDSVCDAFYRDLPLAISWVNDSQSKLGSPAEAAFVRLLEACGNISRSAIAARSAKAKASSTLHASEDDWSNLNEQVSELTTLFRNLSELRETDRREQPSAHSLERALKVKLTELELKIRKMRPQLQETEAKTAPKPKPRPKPSPDTSSIPQRPINGSACGFGETRSEAKAGIFYEPAQVNYSEMICGATVDLPGPLRQVIVAMRDASNKKAIDQPMLREFEGLKSLFLERNRQLYQIAVALGQSKSSQCGVMQTEQRVAVIDVAQQLMQLGSRIFAAAQLKLAAEQSAPAEKSFQSMCVKWFATVEKLRFMIDERADKVEIVRLLKQAFVRRLFDANAAIMSHDVTGLGVTVADAARVANRVVQLASCVNSASSDRLILSVQQLVISFVRVTTDLAKKSSDRKLIASWYDQSRLLLEKIDAVRVALENDRKSMSRSRSRSKLTHSRSNSAFSQPPQVAAKGLSVDSDTDDYASSIGYGSTYSDNDKQSKSEPLMEVAHELHSSAKQWSSRDNEVVASAKRVAHLMALVSRIVRRGSDRRNELLDVATAIEKAAGRIKELSVQLASACRDQLMKKAILHASERIPTLATQLKIMATVKASLPGSRGSEEDRVATEGLIENAKNLMYGIKDTLKAAESASIKMRVDAGFSIRWSRKSPIYL